MAIYRGEGGKTDVVPDSGDYEFAGSIVVEKDVYVGGDINVEGTINGTITGDGSGLENVPTPFLQADDCIYLNNQVIINDYTMPVGKNGMTAGDITVNATVDIPSGSDWHIVGNEDGLVTLETLGIPNHDLLTVTSNGDIVGVPSLSVDGDITSSSGVFTGDGSGLYNIAVEDAYTKNEIDIQQQLQDEKIQANTDAIEAIPGAVDAYTKAEIDAQQSAQDDEINTKIGDAPSDGEQYVRKDGIWAELAAADGGIADAPADGKMYGRQDLKWQEVITDAYTESETDALLDDKADKDTTYTKTEVDASQDAQDVKIDKNITDIAQNTADINQNTSDIAQNTSDIESLADDVDALTGSVIYKGSLNATVVEAPIGSNVGDMWINDYNVSEPSTNYPVASGWAPVTEVKYDDKLIKTDTGWDKIDSVTGVPSYTAGEIDDLLDDKADKTDVYTKTEIDAQQNVQDVEIAKKADKDFVDTELAKKADKETTYTKDEVDELLESASGAIVGNYTNKWADNVARDPEAGNLYLVYGMNISSRYDEVTKMYISDTDGDGDVRDFDEVKENDKVTLSSENGSGEYTIVTITDVGGYRELIVNTESANGTIANDTAVSVVLDIASCNSIWTEVNDVATYDGSVGVGTNTPFAPSGKTLEISDDATTRLILNNKSASRMAILTPNEGGLHFNDYTDLGNVKTPLKIASNGDVLVNGSVQLNTTGTTQPTITLKNDSGYAGVIDVQHDAVIKSGGFEALRVLSANRKIETVADMKVNGVTVGNGGNQYSVAVGQNALASGDSKERSVAVGWGSSKVLVGLDNSTVGFQSATALATGSKNTVFGSNALVFATEGNNNTSVGAESLYRQTTGSENTAIGKSAGDNITTGSNNVCIGNGAQASSATVSNEVTIGNASVTKVRMGNGTILSTTAYVQEQVAIKDKLIEKLSARLDELEKRIK